MAVVKAHSKTVLKDSSYLSTVTFNIAAKGSKFVNFKVPSTAQDHLKTNHIYLKFVYTSSKHKSLK